jgi:hypothetical protein
MANDGGLISVLAQWMADELYALIYNDNPVFKREVAGKSPKSADLYRHQVGATKAGIEASERFAPFAFVAAGDENADRAGGYDLLRRPQLRVFLGTVSKEDGVALWGDGTQLGINKITDLVIALFDKKRPSDTSITCEDFYYDGFYEILDAPKIQWRQLNFEVGQLPTE